MQCNNCETNFEGNFCPNCGQRPNSGRIVFRESARDVMEHYFDFDAPLFRTIKGLTIRPGKLIREYIFGKRKKYSHPIRYYVLVLAIYLILQSILGFDPIEIFGEMMGVREQPNPDSIQTKGSYFFRDNINLFLLLFGFFIAVFSRLFFRKSGFYFAEYLALGFFIVAQYVFFSIFIVPLTFISPYFFLINYILVLFYPVYVQFNFHEGKSTGKFFKSFFISIISWILYVVTGHFLAIFIVIVFEL